MAQKNEREKRHGNSRGYISVLIARFSAIGDVAMTIPVVYSAARSYPDIQFVMVTRPRLTSLFINAPDNLRVIGADVKNEYRGLWGIGRLAKDLMKEFHPDVFLDLHNVLRTKVLSGFLRLKNIPVFTLRKGRSKRKALVRRHNKILLPLANQNARFRQVFHRAGLIFEERFDGLYGGHSKAPVEDFACIISPKRVDEKWIGIAPFAAHKGKIYPIEMMAEVVEKLVEFYGDKLKIFLFGAAGDEEAALLKWVERWPQSIRSLAGKKYGFPAELALINHLDCMVSMDSANMHFGALTSTPTLSIWGGTHPYCGFSPWRQSEDDAIQVALSCRPCSIYGQKECYRGDYLCLTAIKPASIVERIKTKLGEV